METTSTLGPYDQLFPLHTSDNLYFACQFSVVNHDKPPKTFYCILANQNQIDQQQFEPLKTSIDGKFSGSIEQTTSIKDPQQWYILLRSDEAVVVSISMDTRQASGSEGFQNQLHLQQSQTQPVKSQSPIKKYKWMFILLGIVLLLCTGYFIYKHFKDNSGSDVPELRVPALTADIPALVSTPVSTPVASPKLDLQSVLQSMQPKINNLPKIKTSNSTVNNNPLTDE